MLTLHAALTISLKTTQCGSLLLLGLFVMLCLAACCNIVKDLLQSAFMETAVIALNQSEVAVG
jgi:hypothetical protein